jgi:hypothetical protein
VTRAALRARPEACPWIAKTRDHFVSLIISDSLEDAILIHCIQLTLQSLEPTRTKIMQMTRARTPVSPSKPTGCDHRIPCFWRLHAN